MTQKEQREIFSKNLNAYIQRTGKQQIQIADELDIAKTTFNNWCTGVSVPKWGTVRKLAEYFDIPPSCLTDENPIEERTDIEIVMQAYLKNNPQGQLLLELEQELSDMSEEQVRTVLDYARFIKGRS